VLLLVWKFIKQSAGTKLEGLKHKKKCSLFTTSHYLKQQEEKIGHLKWIKNFR